MIVTVPAASIDAAEWNATVDRLQDAWWWHRSEWRAYQAARGLLDLSVGFREDATGDLVGLAPLMVSQATASGEGYPAPVADRQWIEDTDVRRLAAAWAASHGVEVWLAYGRPVDPLDGCRAAPDACTRVVCIGDETPGILWQNIRRSYHAIIHKAGRDYAMHTWSGESGGDISAAIMCCADIHRTAAGRDTRSAATWELMGDWVRKGHALIIGVSHNADLAGYIYVITYKSWAYYASAATLAKNLNHALQWAAIKTLRQAGIAHYELGYMPANPTEKERSIQHFKEGFGGADWPFEVTDVLRTNHAE